MCVRALRFLFCPWTFTIYIYSCVTHSAHRTHPDDGLDEGRLPFVFIVHQVDVGPVSERFSHDGQVSGFGGFAEQRPRGQLPEVLGVRRLRLRLPARVLRHLALWGEGEGSVYLFHILISKIPSDTVPLPLSRFLTIIKNKQKYLESTRGTGN